MPHVSFGAIRRLADMSPEDFIAPIIAACRTHFVALTRRRGT